MVRFFEPTIAAAPKDELGLPGVFFFLAETLLIFDHRTRGLRIVCNALVKEGDVDEAYARPPRESRSSPRVWPATPASRRSSPSAQPEPIAPRCNTTREEYMQMVRDGMEYIRAGDIFQFVPSQRFETDYTGDPLTLYRALRFVNPSPYMFCLKFAGRFALVGSSPEVHVRAINGRIEIRPIAGTRRRGATEEEDDRNAADPPRRSQGTRRTPHARRSRAQRRRPHRQFRHVQGHATS